MGPDGAGWSMGQVLGFSHCKEFGSVSTTPDSSPSSTEGGNDESEFPELQTAHDWSAEDDDDGRGSPLVWGTPRQNSYELTFSYITFAEPQGSPSRREPVGCRRPRRERPAGLRRTDTTETLLPEDAVDAFPQWDPAFSLMEDPEPWDSRLSEDLVQGAHGILDGHFHLGTRVSEMNGQEGDRGIHRQNPDVATCPLGSESVTSGRVSHSPEYHTTYMTLNFSMESGYQEDKDLGIRCSHPRGQDTQVAPIISQSEAFGDGQHWTKGVSELIYWKDAKWTGFIFTGLVVALITLSQISIISIASNLSLTILCMTISARLYMKILKALKKSDGTNPFQTYLDVDISLTQEQTQKFVDRIILMVTSAMTELRRLFLVDSFIDSIKFTVLMYLLTYIGAVFNGLTLVIIAVICVFSIPLMYRQHQAQIDQYVGLVTSQIGNIREKFRAKIPSAKAKEQ